MPAKTVQQQGLLPFRDENNITIRYAPAPGVRPSHTALAASTGYESDFEPLIAGEDLDEDALMHFTATGRPVPQYKGSALASLGGHMYTAPQLLPKRYTDDSIIPAIITDVIPAENKNKNAEGEKKKKGLLGKLKGGKKEEAKSEKGLLKVVFMPRREYQKYFARDLKGNYIGSEPFRRWTEEELDELYGRYKPAKLERRRFRGSV
ncbi:hypothetical protein N431DRAFT_439190 [Stipitochalara longipes BDJ]|nr:hypothetical protein N431DRAFT_439190 [Stipitochalara longipes BDJ]